MSTKTDNILSPNSCWNLAEPDEPIFVLRGNDDRAHNAVVLWAVAYMQSKGGYHRMTPEQIDKYNEAMSTAKAMRNWSSAKLTKQFGGEDDIPF